MCFLVGGFAFVYEAQDLGSGKDYALKVKWIYFSTGLQSLSFYFSLTVNPWCMPLSKSFGKIQNDKVVFVVHCTCI